MIKIQGVSKVYDKITALTEIDLAIARGRIFGLTGTNGAGRTTLLNILATLLRPTSGFVEIDGVDALKSPFEVRSRIGYVPESCDSYDHLTGAEFLDFIAACRQIKPTSAKRAYFAGGLLDGLKRDKPIRLLSRGIRQQLAWAAALLHDPTVLLLDEPMNHLDPIVAASFENTLRKFRDTGGTVVMASNRPADLQALCGEVGFLHNSRLLRVMRIEGLSLNLPELLQSLVAQQRGINPGVAPIDNHEI